MKKYTNKKTLLSLALTSTLLLLNTATLATTLTVVTNSPVHPGSSVVQQGYLTVSPNGDINTLTFTMTETGGTGRGQMGSAKGVLEFNNGKQLDEPLAFDKHLTYTDLAGNLTVSDLWPGYGSCDLPVKRIENTNNYTLYCHV